jgi:hypothetical protein
MATMRTLVCFKRLHSLPACHVPNPHAAILAAGDEHCAADRYTDISDGSAVAVKPLQLGRCVCGRIEASNSDRFKSPVAHRNDRGKLLSLESTDAPSNDTNGKQQHQQQHQQLP